MKSIDTMTTKGYIERVWVPDRARQRDEQRKRETER